MTRASPPPDTAAESRIGRDWPRSLGPTVICVGIAAFASYGLGLDPDGYFDRSLRSASFIMLLVFSVLSLFAIWSAAIPSGPPVRIGPSGLTDLRAAGWRSPGTRSTMVSGADNTCS